MHYNNLVIVWGYFRLLYHLSFVAVCISEYRWRSDVLMVDGWIECEKPTDAFVNEGSICMAIDNSSQWVSKTAPAHAIIVHQSPKLHGLST